MFLLENLQNYLWTHLNFLWVRVPCCTYPEGAGGTASYNGWCCRFLKLLLQLPFSPALSVLQTRRRTWSETTCRKGALPFLFLKPKKACRKAGAFKPPPVPTQRKAESLLFQMVLSEDARSTEGSFLGKLSSMRSGRTSSWQLLI